MGTVLSIEGDRFLINGKLTYSEIEHCPEKYHGLLMNARFIQGIFNDSLEPERFCRFGRHFDPEENTRELIKALPQWYAQGLRCFTAGFQGGGPCYTINSMTIDNNPFSVDGRRMDGAYLRRMKDVILAADQLGMIVIVSLFYGPQSRFLKDDRAVMEGVKTAANWLRDEHFTNVILEVANEHDIEAYKIHPILYNDSGIAELIEIAKRESGGLPVVWGIKNDEDRFFAMRMAQSLGISSCDLPVQSCFEIAGLDDDPFSVNYLFNWLQMPVEGIQTGETVKAVIRLAGGQTIVKEKIAR